MKIFKYTLAILLVIFIYEGFSGEFANPTVFDFIKWICFIIAAITYGIYRRYQK